MATETITLVFNKLSGAFIGSIKANENLNSESLNHDNYLYRSIEMDEGLQEWSGDYETGQLISKAQAKSVVFESELDAHARDKVFGRYQYYHQLNILADLVEQLVIANHTLSEKLNDPNLAVTQENCLALGEMREYIAAVRANNERYKQGYISSPDYEYQSKQDEAEHLSRQLDGGLHELFGRPIDNAG